MATAIYVNDNTVIISNGVSSDTTISVVAFLFNTDPTASTVTLLNANNDSYKLRILSSELVDKSGVSYGTYTDVVDFLTSITATPPEVIPDYYPDVQVVDTIRYAMRVDEKSTPKTVYVGTAEISALDADPVWRMYMIDTTTGADITWADGDDLFDNIWDDRITLTYT